MYIAGIMLISIVVTALIMQVSFTALGIVPESRREVGQVTQFALDYTFYLNIPFVIVAVVMVLLHRRHIKTHGQMEHEMEGDSKTKRIIALAAGVILIAGSLANIFFSN